MTLASVSMMFLVCWWLGDSDRTLGFEVVVSVGYAQMNVLPFYIQQSLLWAVVWKHMHGITWLCLGAIGRWWIHKQFSNLKNKWKGHYLFHHISLSLFLCRFVEQLTTHTWNEWDLIFQILPPSVIFYWTRTVCKKQSCISSQLFIFVSKTKS